MRNCIESALLEGAPNPAPRLIEIVGPHPGPCVALLGGIHGDEDEGVLSVRRVIAMLRDRPIAGTVLSECAAERDRPGESDRWAPSLGLLALVERQASRG